MKYSLLSFTIVSALLLSGCGNENGCSSCAHSQTEQPACSTCPTTFPVEAITEVETEIFPNDGVEETIVDEELAQK